MPSNKPWTVMVYLAADNNLTNFGIDSLKQMRSVCGDSVNVLAEFYSGPWRPTKRYLFDHKTVLGSIDQNIIDELPARDAGKPENLSAFVEWAAKHYPADHYFLIIWGHGSGCDDDFPRDPQSPSSPNRSFVQRHQLLDYGKGVYDDASKGVLDEARKGVAGGDGILIATKVSGHITAALKKALSEASSGSSPQDKRSVQKEILYLLETATVTAFQEGFSEQLTKRVLPALKSGVQKAARLGAFTAIQTRIFDAFQSGGSHDIEARVREEISKGAMNSLFLDILNTIQRGAQEMLPVTPAGTKGLGFSDHPASYLTNLQVQEALRNGCDALPDGKRKLDIVGMDACNMNMLEIGYEVRNYAQYLVASQDAIPDASWPYDGILRQLMGSPSMSPRELACVTATAYVENYRDYVNQPVALSVLNLEASKEIADPFKVFTEKMKKDFKDPDMMQAILSARKKARSFGQNQFVDLKDFCQHLAEEPQSKDAGAEALSLMGNLMPFVAYNEFTACLKGRNGTSIYFPVFNPANAKHQHNLASRYTELDFPQQTGWGEFVAEFLKQQQEDWESKEIAKEVEKLPIRPSESKTDHDNTALDRKLEADHDPGSLHGSPAEVVSAVGIGIGTNGNHSSS